MSVAIVGARGFGQYHVRQYASLLGSDKVHIVGTTLTTSRDCAEATTLSHANACTRMWSRSFVLIM